MNNSALTHLQTLRDEYSARCAALQRDLSAAHSSDSAEQAQERENDEIMQALLAEAESLLQQTEAAIARYQDGRYGFCSQCGKPIAAARLEALPVADTCIACAAS